MKNRPSQQRVLVTGATGFLGGHVVRALIERGDWVRAVGRNEAACRRLECWGAHVRRGSLCDPRFAADVCRGMDVVCHAAALSAPWGPRKVFMGTNVDGTRNVVAGCLAHQIRQMVYVSSPSITSDWTDFEDATEDAPWPAQFISTYSESKKFAEDVVRQAAEAGLCSIILRPKAIFGPGDSALLPRILLAAGSNRLRQIGDGSNRVDLTYVDNVVHAVLLALDSTDLNGRCFTITNNEHPLLWPLLRDVIRRMGYNAEFGRVPFRVAWLAARAMELKARFTGKEPLMTRYFVTILAKNQTYDISAARERLGYLPQVTLSDGIDRTLKHLIS